jgi:hypothetical protein
LSVVGCRFRGFKFFRERKEKNAFPLTLTLSPIGGEGKKFDYFDALINNSKGGISQGTFNIQPQTDFLLLLMSSAFAES